MGRSQINLAPYEANNSDQLIVGSGKANNVEEFEPFGITLQKKTMSYFRDPSINVDEWKERLGVDRGSGSKSDIRATLDDVIEQVRMTEPKGIEKAKLVLAIMKETGVGKTYACNLIKNAHEQKHIKRVKGGIFHLS